MCLFWQFGKNVLNCTIVLNIKNKPALEEVYGKTKETLNGTFKLKIFFNNESMHQLIMLQCQGEKSTPFKMY